MAYVNSFKATSFPSPTYGPEPYDVNFAFAIPPTLSTSRVELVPFIPSQHAQIYHENTRHEPQLHRYLPVELDTLNSVLSFIEYARLDHTWIQLAIINISDDRQTVEMAGMVGLLNASSLNLSAEIGAIVVFPRFQRTHVTAHTIGILLRYCFNLPSEGGLGLRRVQWTANPLNERSVKTAQKMGMKIEGTMRWTWVLPEGKEGKRRGEEKWTGRDSVLLAVCWDDWESEVKGIVEKLIEKV